jgi:hypothetical protein
MQKFIINEWKAICLFILSVAWIGIFPIWSKWVTSSPLNEPITLYPPGKIVKEIEIRIPENMELALIFERNSHPFDELDRLVGSMGICIKTKVCSKGVPVNISWSIKSKKESHIFSSGIAESFDSNSWSKAEVGRYVADIQAPTGVYIFNAEVLKPVPEFSHIKTRLQIATKPKSSNTWQMGLVWWGTIGRLLIALPVGFFALIHLLLVSKS